MDTKQMNHTETGHIIKTKRTKIRLQQVQGKRKTNLKYSDDGPEKRVKVFAVRDGVTVVCLKAELAAKQMHTQYTAGR